MEARVGDVVSYCSRAGNWFSRAQQFFTRMRYTHSSVFAGEILPGDPSEYEAVLAVGMRPTSYRREDPLQDVWLWRVDIGTDDDRTAALVETHRTCSDEDYGFLQLLYFVRRWFWTIGWVRRWLGWIPKLAGKPADPRKWNQWFPRGRVCSEVVYIYLHALATIAGDEEMLAILSEWDGNNFHSGDVVTVLTAHSRCEVIYEWDNAPEDFRRRYAMAA